MAESSTWLRRIGTAFAALVLVLLTFGPGIEGLLCHDEGSLSAAAAEFSPPEVAADQDLGDHGQGDADVCVHGHCHHGGAFVPPSSAPTKVQAAEAGGHALPREKLPISDPTFGLKRPPRA